MKIRTDFVSNSSSSSFVILGQTIEFGKLQKAIIKKFSKRGLVKKIKEREDDFESNDLDEIIDCYGWHDIIEMLDDSLRIEVEGEDLDEDADALVGIDLTEVKDSDTIGSLKDKVAEKLNAIGIPSKRNKIEIVSGATEACGLTFFESCG